MDQEIQATQTKQDEMQKRLQCDRRRATIHSPMSQFDGADPDVNDKLVNQTVIQQSVQHDYLFNLTGIVPPQPPKWKQVNHLYEDFKEVQKILHQSVLKDQWLNGTKNVKVNMLLLWCGPDGEDIYEGFNLPIHQQYNLELIWALFDRHCKPICNFCAARWKI